jgi:RNA polymerase sigma-54 factor
MSLRLQQKLSFQMIQSLKLLQVNTLQLEQLLKTEMELNPVLELTDDQEEEQEEERTEEEEKEKDEKEDDELDVNEESIDWEEYLEEGFDLGSRMSEEEDHGEKRYEPTPVYQISLTEHLETQLTEKRLDEKRRLLCQFLIGSLDLDGYLRLTLENAAEVTQTTVFDAEEALAVIQSMDPPGVGARTLQECLLLQLVRRGQEASLPARILRETWELFEKMKVPEISRRLGVDPRDIQQSFDIIRTLNPKPGYAINSEHPSTIVPDLIVEKIDGEFVVMLNDRSVPSLHINGSYAKMIRRGSKAKAEIKNYVREKLNSATWLIRSIEQRKTTMLKVMNAIIDKQRDFFEKGPPNLNPLKLQDIADMISMHISTVSRVTSNKYVQTPFGIYELKYFFTEAMGQDTEGSDVSAERIRNRIRELVENETPTKPLSDQKIAEMLGREGYAVARRTVAKYREQLKILPARLRQKYE